MSKLIKGFSGMPRSARWLIVFCGFLALYFAVLEPAMNASNSASERADRLEAALLRERAVLAANSPSGRELERGMVTYGLPRHPTSRDARPETLQRTVNSILLDHGIENAVYSERSGTIRADEATAVVGATSRLERFVLDVTFETSPTKAMAILSDLEKSQDVTAVSRVKIDKSLATRGRGSEEGSSRNVRVIIAVESWIASRGVEPGTASAAWSGAEGLR